MRLVNFIEAINRLGRTDNDRARALGMTRRGVVKWKQRQPLLLRFLVRHPDLLEALQADAKRIAEDDKIAS